MKEKVNSMTAYYEELQDLGSIRSEIVSSTVGAWLIGACFGSNGSSGFAGLVSS